MGTKNHEINFIQEGTTISGTLSATKPCRIDGEVTGELACEDKVAIGPSGRFDGIISAREIVIEGEVKGIVFGKDRIVLLSTAKVAGTVLTASLIVQEGATFNGTCHMGEIQLLTQTFETLKKSETNTISLAHEQASPTGS